ncbi:subtilisin-like protease [Rickenella mellea]|uniref:Subtilisin-like protease n=1 Tax=Rickenella mellea TaxID=50990 RepID=A0A4Y7QFY1_9AGAM|nr:subtilisin-like protease [Rickenella mellea]
MKATACKLLTLLISASLSFATVPLSSIQRVTTAPIIPNKFIVEVEDVSQIPTKRSMGFSHDHVYASLRKRGVKFKVNQEFKAQGLFTGAALTLTNPSDLESLSNTPGVVAVRPVVKVPAPNPLNKKIPQSASDPSVPPDSESTHILTNVDKLHAEGVLGTGVKIGIIDTGVDYTHPSLGGGFGPGHKIAGGFDFVGDAYDGTNTPVPDPDPLDQCNGHGTHVAGIVGANPGNEFGISGVAYQATINAYRIFGCAGQVTDDVIVQALLRGVSDGMDILTMSLGGADGWTESTSSVVSSRISDMGKVVTIAAGNDGAFGSWYTSSPGNAIDAISVASLDNTVVPIQNATVHGVTHDPVPYFSLFPLSETQTLPIFATSTDVTVVDDACNPLPASTPNLANFVTIIRRGSCTFVQKLTNAAAFGANVVLIYDNGNGFAPIDTGNFTQASLIQAADGVFLVGQFAAKAPLTLSFPQTGGSFNFPNPTGGLISTFSSYGPSNDMFFKPAVAAPGGNILSTFPVPLGSFALLSGTSMATPFIAGSSALLFEVKGKSAAVGKSIRTLLETTAQRVPSSLTDGDPLQTLSQAGAGLVDVHKAARTTTIVSPGEFLLNDTSHFNGVQTFTISNTGTTSKKYTISHVPAGTATSITPSTIFAADGPVPLTATFASVKFSKTSVTIAAGGKASITATFTPPAGLKAATFPVYSGFLEIASGADTTHVSYLGVANKLRDKTIIDNTDVFFGIPLPALLDASGNPQAAPTNYTLVGTDFPSVLSRLAFGTPEFRIDLVLPNTTVKPTISKRGSFAKVPIVASIQEFQFTPRNSDAAVNNGFNLLAFSNATSASGTPIPNGQYKFLLRALRVTGNVQTEADYESWLSPTFGINHG